MFLENLRKDCNMPGDEKCQFAGLCLFFLCLHEHDKDQLTRVMLRILHKSSSSFWMLKENGTWIK